MNEHHMKGAFNDLTGRVQGASSALADDAVNELKGKAREASGKAEAAYGDAVDAFGDAASSMARTIQANPRTAILMAGAVGFVIAWLMRRD